MSVSDERLDEIAAEINATQETPAQLAGLRQRLSPMSNKQLLKMANARAVMNHSELGEKRIDRGFWVRLSLTELKSIRDGLGATKGTRETFEYMDKVGKAFFYLLHENPGSTFDELLGKMEERHITPSREELQACCEITTLLADAKDPPHHVPPGFEEFSHHLVDLSASCFIEVKQWICAKNFKLERPDRSLHHLWREWLGPYYQDGQIFLIEHDWAGAFKGNDEFNDDSEFHLPAPVCHFEFAVSGKRVISAFSDIENMVPAFWIKNDKQNLWLKDNAFASTPEARDGVTALRLLLWRNVAAACISLDAKIAVHAVTRAPYRLNAARERRGKLPFNDYHVIKLARREGADRLPAAESTHNSPRFHFRRGHYRHFVGHKTWINWTLVGDPDLGFIEKTYRL
jgi:hypothetical protein